MQIQRDGLSLALVASGLVGAQILASDTWLWSAAPSHAYGLVGFVAIDLVLAGALLWRARSATIAAATIGLFQLGAMLADAATGQPVGVAPSAFKSYLLNNASYVWLLYIQLAIVAIAAYSLITALWDRHDPWTVTSS